MFLIQALLKQSQRVSEFVLNPKNRSVLRQQWINKLWTSGDPDAATVLVLLLKDKSADIRHSAAQALGWLSEDTEICAPELRQMRICLRNEEDVRVKATLGLAIEAVEQNKQKPKLETPDDPVYQMVVTVDDEKPKLGPGGFQPFFTPKQVVQIEEEGAGEDARKIIDKLNSGVISTEDLADQLLYLCRQADIGNDWQIYLINSIYRLFTPEQKKEVREVIDKHFPDRIQLARKFGLLDESGIPCPTGVLSDDAKTSIVSGVIGEDDQSYISYVLDMCKQVKYGNIFAEKEVSLWQRLFDDSAKADFTEQARNLSQYDRKILREFGFINND